MRIAEDKWGIWIKIAEEWEKTFVTLLEYYNTKDLRSICQSIFLNERGMTKNKLISVKELEKWMKPQMEPSPWMQILAKVSPRWRKKYRESKKKFEKDHDNFIGSEATMFQKTIRGRSQITKQESTEKKKTLSKIDFVRSIVNKLRKGDEEVSSQEKLFLIYKPQYNSNVRNSCSIKLFIHMPSFNRLSYLSKVFAIAWSVQSFIGHGRHQSSC